MKKFTKFLGVLLVVFFSLLSHRADASHYKGGDIYFVCLGGGQYELVFSAYYACEASSIRFDSIPGDFEWTVTSTCGIPSPIVAATASISQDVPFYCPGVATTCDYWNGSSYNAPAGTAIGTAVVTYTSAPFSIPAGCTVTATMAVSARNGAISNLQNPASQYLNISTSVTTPSTGLACSNNPVFAAYPVNVFCVNQNANFSQGAIDISGDSLTYKLVNPETSGGIAIPFVAGCTATNPMGAPTVFASVFSFDTTTGNVNFTPTATGDYVLAVQVDAYENGVLVGTTVRDIQFTVVQCNNYTAPPFLTSLFTTQDITGGTVIDSTHVGVCPGEPVQINLVATIGDSFQHIIDSTNALQALPGSTVSVTHSGTKFDTATLHINWTPQNSDSGYHYILVTIKDTICPLPGTQTYAFLVSVLSGLYAGPNLVYCNGGAPVTIYANGANHYLWTDSATGGPPLNVIAYGPDSSWIEVAPTATTGYIVHGDLIGSCKNIDTVTVVNAPDFTLHATALDTSICKYSSTTLTASTTPGSVGPFTYSWSPVGSVVSPTSGTTPTTNLVNNTKFYVTAVAAAGCTLMDSVSVDLSGAAPFITIIPSANNVCPGDTVNLNTVIVSQNLLSCGASSTLPVGGLPVSAAVPDDTLSSTGEGGAYIWYGSPFEGDYNSFKIQYLFTAADMYAAGLSSGAIRDISFFVKQINSSVPYDTFSISMGCTDVDSLTDFITGLQTVMNPTNGIVPNLGWTTLPFNTYFNWDGSSNIVIQVCYTFNASETSSYDYVSYSTTPINGASILTGNYGVDGCSQSYGSGVLNSITNNRANIRFDMTVPNVLTYQWSPASLPCHTCPNTQVVVNGTGTYTLSVSDGICASDTSITLQVNPYTPATARPDTTLCVAGDTVNLNISQNVTPPSQCYYTVAPATYAVINGTVTTIPGVDYVDMSGLDYATYGGVAGPIDIGFTFPFYCDTFSRFWVNSNGWISFVDPYASIGYQGSWENQAQSLPPASQPPLKAIELLMGHYFLADGLGDGGGSIRHFVSGTAPNRILVVRFVNMDDIGISSTTSGEMHLYETSGRIDILLKSSTYSGTPHTTGIIDTVGIGLAAPDRNDSAYTITTNEEWTFTPASGPSVAVNSSVWSPATFISNVDTTSPLVYPQATQTYTVQSNVAINQFTAFQQLCVVKDTVTVGVDVFRNTLSTLPNTGVCPGDTVHIRFTPLNNDTVSSYTWTPPTYLDSTTVADPFAILGDTTTYYVTAVDKHGCTVIDTVTLSTLPALHPLIGPDTTVCYNGSATLASTTGTYTNYQWYYVDSTTQALIAIPGATSPTYNGSPTNVYVLKITAPGYTCSFNTNPDTVSAFPVPVVTVDSSGPLTFCDGGSVTLNVSAGLNNIQWTPASFGSASSIPVTASGTFSYTAHDVHNCTVTSNTVAVTVNPIPVFVLSPYKNPICTTDTDVLTAATSPAGAALTWTYHGVSAPGNTYTATDSGTYYLVADLAGCTDDTSIALVRAVSPSVSLGAGGTFCGCNPDSVITPVITPASAADTYTWSDGTHGATNTDTATGTTTYIVTVTDANNCTSAATVAITFNCPRVDIAVNPVSDTIFLSDSATLIALQGSGSTGATAYQWGPSGFILSPLNDSVHIIAQHPGIDTFYVIATDAIGCTDSVVQYVNVIEFGSFVMPTAFTPNGDTKNPYFYPVSNGPNSPTKVLAFTIYNRWGQQIYSDPNAPGWDGTYGGKPQPVDTYLYYVTVEYPDPSNAARLVQKSVEGSFQLFR